MLLSFKLSFCVAWLGVLLEERECSRIVGGRPGYQEEVPYQISLRRSYNDAHFCGGSIITPLHVLTAAHCMFYTWGGLLPPIVVSVVAGQISLPMTNTSVYRNASEITVHEDFDKTLMSNDIAIIKVDSEFPIYSNKLITAIPLRNTPINSGACIVSGWGFQEHESGIISNVLLTAEVNVIEFALCYQMYAKEYIELSQGMLCAGHERGETDACQGDSGGPLVCDGLLTGVISTGSGCGEPEFPGIYSDVFKFLPWIQDKIYYNMFPSTIGSSFFSNPLNIINSTTTESAFVDNVTWSISSQATDSLTITTASSRHTNITLSVVTESVDARFSGNTVASRPDTTTEDIVDTTTFLDSTTTESGVTRHFLCNSSVSVVLVLIWDFYKLQIVFNLNK